MLKDTIIAVSTPPGYGGLGVIRISGRKALSIGRKIFCSDRLKSSGIEPRRPVLGKLYDFEEKIPFDEALLTYFKAPHTYTREDIVELSCHGSPVTLERAVRMGVLAGARAAHPGEFTLRAYLHGRIDIIQAEAVNDLIRAVSPLQAAVSFRQLSGSLSGKIGAIRRRVLNLAAQIEAGLEFPEEGLRINRRTHARVVDEILHSLERFIGTFEAGKAMRDGLTLAITGRTNVGKSTLFNALLGVERAIVTPYPGTTRDFLRERIILGDRIFHLVDMAGLGLPGHPVEKEGIAKGREIAGDADGLLIVIDGSRDLSSTDKALIRKYGGKKRIFVVNKSDLPGRIGRKGLRSLTRESPVHEVSALQGDGIAELRERIRDYFVPLPDFTEEIILHSRQRDLLEELRQSFQAIDGLLAGKQSEEIIAEEVRTAVTLIGRLTGAIRTEEVMEDIFSRFCVGK